MQQQKGPRQLLKLLQPGAAQVLLRLQPLLLG